MLPARVTLETVGAYPARFTAAGIAPVAPVAPDVPLLLVERPMKNAARNPTAPSASAMRTIRRGVLTRRL